MLLVWTIPTIRYFAVTSDLGRCTQDYCILQAQVLDQICNKENGEFWIPDIPKEIQDCVEKPIVDEASSVISFDIVSPCTKDKLLVVESDLEDVKCTPDVTEEDKEEEESVSQIEDQTTVGTGEASTGKLKKTGGRMLLLLITITTTRASLVFHLLYYSMKCIIQLYIQ